MNKKQLLSVPALLAAGMLIIVGCSKSGPTAPLNEWQPTDKHHALPETGSISGTVYLDDSCSSSGYIIFLPPPGASTPTPTPCCPYQGALVSLYYNGDLVTQTLSDDEGRYEFAHLLQGFYDVEVTYPKYDFGTRLDDVVVMERQDNGGVDAYYKPYYRPDEISVRFTTIIDPAVAEAILNECGCTTLAPAPTYPTYYYTASIPDSETLPGAMACLDGKPEIYYTSYVSLCPPIFWYDPWMPMPMPIITFSDTADINILETWGDDE